MMLYSYTAGTENIVLRDVVEDPVSVVWTERWDSYGECKVVVPAEEASKVAVGRVLTLEGRRMACQVVTLLVQDGLATATGRDALGWLGYRIIYGTVRRDGYVEGFIGELVESVDYQSTASASRRLPVEMGPSAGIPDTASIQRSWRNVGEVVTEVAQTYGFGVMARLEGQRVVIYCQQRTDRGLAISRELGNLASERILDDEAGEVNRVYVGAGDYRTSPDRYIQSFTYYAREGTGLREAFMDRRDVSTWITYPDLLAEWGQPYGCASATGQLWGFGSPKLCARSVADGSGFRIERVYARVPMLVSSGFEGCVAVESEDFADVLPAVDSLVRSAWTPTGATVKTWTMT